MWQEDIAYRLKEASSAERKHIIAEYREKTGYSKARLYDIAKQYGFDSGRKTRGDKGKCELTDRQIEYVAAKIHVTSREVKGPIMPVAAALEDAIDNGIIERGQISAGRMQQLLRERQINKKALMAPEPYTPMRSLHPNHVHVFDVSVCVQYYLKGGKGLRIMDERDFYKNKLDKYLKIKTRLMRYVIVDHFSGAFFVFYFDAKGESQKNLYQFLIKAWQHKGHEKYPLRGVPFQMLMDSGAANSARAMVAFLERLGVKIPKGEPYNAARQGAVEVMHNIWEMWFESKLRLQPAHTIEDINEWAFDYVIWLNAERKHTRHGMARLQSWIQIKQNELRDLPSTEILQEIFSYRQEDFTRTVNRDYTISYKNKDYNLKHVEGIIPSMSKVIIVIKPFVEDQSVIDIIFNDKQYEIRAVEKLPAHLGGFRADAAIIGQEYKAQPETETQKAIKRFENMAYGEDRKKDAVPFAGQRVFGYHADKVGDIAFMPKKGTAIEVDRCIMDRIIPLHEFFKELKIAIGRIEPWLNQALREEYGDSITKSKAEEVISEIKAGTWKAASMRDDKQSAAM
jgi:uncharacterized protein YeeX (DUF496 family)